MKNNMITEIELGQSVIGDNRRHRLRGQMSIVKVVVDYVSSAIVLILLSPLLVVIILLIKLESKGPAIYKQERVGLGGKVFSMYKFRSMRVAAEADNGPTWAAPDDSRRTAVGAILRRTHIDEISQFVNILKGEMSLIGPRPERPHFVEKFEATVPRYAERHRVKGGITGLAQVNGIKYMTVEETTELDNYYIDNWSLALDLRIALSTLREVFQKRSY